MNLPLIDLFSLYKCLDLDQYSLYTPIGSIKKDSLKKIITGNKAKHILSQHLALPGTNTK